jgi:hypothetical protein
MARIRRFEHSRFVGTRDDMTVYDCDEGEDFAVLQRRVDEEDLLARRLLQAFGPDSLAEARNRGFRPR